MSNQKKNPAWDNITRDELKVLSYEKRWTDSMIAEHFGVNVSSVRYKRRKFRLSAADRMYEEYAKGNTEIFKTLNESAKEWFLDDKNIDIMAKAIANYIFREGPIENLHADKSKNITDPDMKTLNVYMVNQISGLLQYALRGDFLRLRVLLDMYSRVVLNWQAAEPDLNEIQRAGFPIEIVDDQILNSFKRVIND